MDPSRHTDGPALVFAGAGAGKTRNLIHRVNHLVEKGVDPHGITLITFTNKAAQEMRSRLVGLLEEPQAEAVWVGTFHRFCLQALTVYGAEVDLKAFSLLDSSNQQRLAERLVKEIFPEGKDKPKGFTTQAALSAVSRAANSRWDDLQLATMYADLTEKIVSFKYAYMDAKKELGVLDYDDLLLQGIRLFKLSPGAAGMARRRCLYLMVDEFQDTNTVQLELIQSLAPGASPNLMVVGDPDQSIYGWRGADYRTILNFQRIYPTAQVYGLYTNYRSKAAVVELANRVIQGNRERKPGVQTAHHPGGEEPVLMAAGDRAAEAQFVAQAVDYYHRQGIPYEEMAVLMRANFLSLDVEQAFRSRKIPYRFSGGQSFFDRAEVRLAMAVLRVLISPADVLSIGHLAEELVEGAGPAGIEKVLQRGKEQGLSPLESLQDPGALKGLRGEATRKGARELARVLSAQALLLQDPAARVDQVLQDTLEALPVDAWLKKQAQGSEENLLVRRKNRDRFLEVVRAWQESNSEAPLSELLASLVLEALEKEPEQKGVYVMTIHASKGMEFRVTFVVGLNEGVFPLQKATSDLQQLEEERRLFYVAITRAKEYLHLSCAEKGFRGDWQRPSLFCQEARLEIMKYDPRLGFHGTETNQALTGLLNL